MATEIEKKTKKNPLLKTKRARALIFGMKHQLVSV
jgi:hypothetical protein